MAAKGVGKLIEECGELQQVLGKRIAYWSTDVHPDGSDLSVRMTEEMGDVLAALWLVADKFGLAAAMHDRADRKLSLFEQWDAEPDNNVDSIDEATP